jgi:hypothetical protein
MTLIRPLVTSLVKSNVSSIGGGGGFPIDATLEHYYPFASNLNDRQTAASGTLTRASTSTVTDINTGNPITYGIDEPAYNGLSGTGNAIGLGFGASPDDLQLPTFSDNRIVDSEDLSATIWVAQNSAVIDNSNTFTLAAAAGSRVNAIVTSSTVVSTTYYWFVELSTDSGAHDVSLQIDDNVTGDQTSANMTVSTTPSWFMFSGSFDAASTARNVRVKNGSGGGSATINLHKSILSTCPIRPAYIKTTGAAAPVQDEWPVNDCWYYGEIEYEGITGSNGVYLSSEVDASNKTRVNINSSNEVIFQKTVLGASYQPAVTLPSINQGDVIEWGLKQSLWGMELYVAHNGIIYSDLSVTNGDDLPIAATCQVGNLAALTSPLNGYYSNVKTISGISPTFDQVRNIT